MEHDLSDTNGISRDDFDNFVCRTCGHIAVSHVVHRGPCSECWARGLTVCERFRPLAEDMPRIEQQLREAGIIC